LLYLLVDFVSPFSISGLDVYEGEKDYFFRDKSSEVLQDDKLALLLAFPNVVVTSHMAFLTQDALDNIAKTSVSSMVEWISGKPLGTLSHSVIKDYEEEKK
jgi:D-lactate dehydrogenase